MKGLELSQQFTKQYVDDLYDFCSYLIPKINQHPTNSGFFASMSNLKASLNAIKVYLNKKPGNCNNEVQINSFKLPYINTTASKQKDQFSLLIGGYIKFKEGKLVTQSLSFSVVFDVYEKIDEESAKSLRVHNYDAGCHVIRKFHFDIDRTLKDDQAWPISHIQYGGSFPDERYVDHYKEGELNYGLFAPMDDPRLPNLPYGLITCFDVILRSFRTNLIDLPKESAWTKKVVTSEKKWMIPFFQSALDNLDGPNANTFYEFLSKKSDGSLS